MVGGGNISGYFLILDRHTIIWIIGETVHTTYGLGDGLMEHALTACHPCTQYSPGWYAKLIYLPMNYMTTFLMDTVIYWVTPQTTKAL